MSFIPNTTPTPNWLYNGEMRKMNETQLKVVLLVTRKTLGWFDPKTSERKSQDYISQKQFMEFTGKSHTAIAHAIQCSVKAGWIIARDKIGNLCDTPDKRRRRKVWYQLGSVFTNKLSKQDSCLDTNLSNKTHKSKQHNDTNLSNKVDNTKETITKETIQKEKSNNWVKELLIWLEVRRKRKFADCGKQISALGRLKNAGYKPEQIKKYMNTMDRDSFWRDKSPDFVNLAANIHKLR